MSITELQTSWERGGHRKVTHGERKSVATPGFCGGSTDVISPSAAELVRLSGLPRDTYALARVIASEVGPKAQKAATAVAIGHATVNDARRFGGVYQMTTTAIRSQLKDALEGTFGEQCGRRVSSVLDPTTWHVDVAKYVLASRDVTSGADKFLDTGPYNRGFQGSGDKLRPLQMQLELWHKTHAWVGPVLSLPPGETMFFARESNAQKRAAALQDAISAAMGTLTDSRVLIAGTAAMGIGALYWLYGRRRA